MLKGKTGKHTFIVTYNPFKVKCDSAVMREMLTVAGLICFVPNELTTRFCKLSESEEVGLAVLCQMKTDGVPLEVTHSDVTFKKVKEKVKN